MPRRSIDRESGGKIEHTNFENHQIPLSLIVYGPSTLSTGHC